ncbi:hypothetical protein M3Y97_00884900 [Aphelenchoides bicaudatus]|nr:hypothetical protein M3Y97_00884900 [Aphelenchoides bicaudatus]
MNCSLLLLLAFFTVALAMPRPAIQLLDETSLPQVESDEVSSDRFLNEDLSPPVMRKPHKMADRKRKLVDGSPIEKVDEMRGPMDMSPSVDLFQQLMIPIESTSNEAEKMFQMRYQKFDESPNGAESPK